MGITENSEKNIKEYGLRIYTTIKNGPLDRGGAKELSDFIIPPDEVISKKINFEDWLLNHSNQEIIITLYSLLTKSFRDIKIKTNSLGSKDGIIGASVKKENWASASNNVLHIISVDKNSFAQKGLGLIPVEDYIIGVKSKSSPIIPLNQEQLSPLEILGEAIRKNRGKLMKFYIYNKKNGARDITVSLGEDYYFKLGCEGAFGKLHMFPSLDNNDEENQDNNNKLNNNTNLIQFYNGGENINKIFEEMSAQKQLEENEYFIDHIFENEKGNEDKMKEEINDGEKKKEKIIDGRIIIN